MLDILRQNAKNVLTYVLFGIIILVFVVSFGPGARGCSDPRISQSTWAAKINGETLDGAEFEQQYASIFRVYQSRGITRDLADQLGLRRVAMDQLIERELLLQEGDRLGLVVTDEDLEKAIKAIPAFQVDGRFDIELYKRAVAASYGTAGRFEERMRRDLQAQKAKALLRESIQVSPQEVRQAWEADGDRVELEVARFPVSALAGAEKPSAEQVKAFQAKHADRIAQAYKEAGDRFDRKKEVRARHILFRADAKAAPEADAKARQKAEDVLARLKKGEDFGKLAAELSEDPGSREKGGDLDWFGPGIMAKPFEDAALGAAKGALVGPVRTPFGWHVLRVDDVRGPEVIPLEKAAPELARELVETDLAKAAAGKRAAEVLAQARKAKTLAELLPLEPEAGKKGPAPVKLGKVVIRAEDTGPFGASAKPNVPRVGPQAELFADALAATGPGMLPRVYETAAGPVIARVKERQRPDPAKFEAQRAEMEERLRGRREAQVESAWMKQLRERAKVQVNEAYVRGEVSLPPVQLDQ
jgi:peptidyl-prolyl cis-trans isomerase D